VDNLGYLLAGYLITGLSLAAYVTSLYARGRRARRRTDSLGARPRVTDRP